MILTMAVVRQLLAWIQSLEITIYKKSTGNGHRLLAELSKII